MFLLPAPMIIKSMFLALKDILHARGRFGLITAVVGLITFLVVMLGGLTQGLAQRNISALETLGVQGYAIELTEDEPNFTSSQISQADLAEFQKQGPAFPLGTGNSALQYEDSTISVATFGLPVSDEIPAKGIVISDELEIAVGDTVSVSGVDLPVVGTTNTEYFSHSPVIWMSTFTWQDINHTDAVGSAIALGEDPDIYNAGIPTFTVKESFNAVPAFSSEQGSLLLIQGFLYVISALVIISFLTVWTIQRSRDLAILRVIGASPRYLLIDALGQAALILAVGCFVGAGIGAGLGWAISGVAPFHLAATTVILPAVMVFVLGLIGAGIATRSISRVDPLSAFSAV